MNVSTETRHDTRQTVTTTNIDVRSDSNLSTHTEGDER